LLAGDKGKLIHVERKERKRANSNGYATLYAACKGGGGRLLSTRRVREGFSFYYRGRRKGEKIRSRVAEVDRGGQKRAVFSRRGTKPA